MPNKKRKRIKSMKRRFISLLLVMVMIFALMPITASAKTKTVTIKAPRSILELNAKWEALKPAYTSGSPYTIVPEISPASGDPTLGKVKSQVLKDGLNTLNFARYMAGMTGDVSLVTDFNISAQYASVLLAYRDNGMTHYPEKPSGVSLDFYKKGYEGTSNSCLHMWYSSSGESTAISDSVKGYLYDWGESNHNVAGHRYWVLDPSIKGVGFGLAPADSGNLYSAFWCAKYTDLNGTGTPTTNYEAVTWPVAGYHATDFYGKGLQWSVRLNPKRYDIDKLEDVKVSVTGPGGTSVLPHAFSSVYGNMIMFTPTDSVQAGEKYTVEISGLYRNNESTTLKYSVKFFTLGKPDTSSAGKLAADKIAVEKAVKDFGPVANNYTKPKDLLNCIWAETKYIDKIEWVAEPTIKKAKASKKGSIKGTIKCTLNGKSFTYKVKMSIPEPVVDKNAYKALAAAKAMNVSASTTQKDVEKALNAKIGKGYTVSLSYFTVKTPTATETGSVSYYLTVRDSRGESYGPAGVVQVIPVLGRKATNGK